MAPFTRADTTLPTPLLQSRGIFSPPCFSLHSFPPQSLNGYCLWIMLLLVNLCFLFLFKFCWFFAIWMWFQLETLVQGLANYSSVQSLSRVWLFAAPWTAAHQASLSITNFQSLLRLMSTELVVPSNHLILCCSLLLPPSIFPRLRVFSSESALHSRWPKYWSFSFSISPSNEYSGPISFRTDWLNILSKGFSRVFSNTTVQKNQFFSAQLSL